MRRKRKGKSPEPAHAEPKAKPIFVSPFKELGKIFKQREITPARPLPVPVKVAAPVKLDSDEDLLRSAFDGIRPLANRGPTRLPVEPKIRHEVVTEDAEVLARLSDLVSGQG